MKYSSARTGWRPAFDLLLVAGALFAAGYALAGEADRPMLHTASYAPSSSLMVRVTLPEAAQGDVRLGLYDTPAGYNADARMLERTVSVEAGRAEFDLRDLPSGRYAFRLFHDANGNGTLDTGAFGLPTEALFYSNDASDLFSAPEWEEASFRLSDGDFAYEVALD